PGRSSAGGRDLDRGHGNVQTVTLQMTTGELWKVEPAPRRRRGAQQEGLRGKDDRRRDGPHEPRAALNEMGADCRGGTAAQDQKNLAGTMIVSPPRTTSSRRTRTFTLSPFSMRSTSTRFDAPRSVTPPASASAWRTVMPRRTG